MRLLSWRNVAAVKGGARSPQYPKGMELPWPSKRCISCLRDDVEMTRAHLIPESIGGFLWARTHCQTCNSHFGATVEAGVKDDPGIRLAIERALAGELPDLARTFAEGQLYIAKSPHGVFEAKVRGGEFEMRSSTNDSGTLTQDSQMARKSVQTMLERDGLTSEQIQAALVRLDNAGEGDLTPLTDSLAVRHGVLEGWDLPWNGDIVSLAFPAVVGFHFLALCIGPAIFHEGFNGVRDAIRVGETRSVHHVVESLRADRGYQPHHLVGIAQTMPHIVLSLHLFGERAWRVHLPLLSAAKTLKLIGVVLDLKSGEPYLIEPAPMAKPLEVPQQ